MKQKTNFSQEQEHNAEQQTQTGKEFVNSDDLIGFDASQTNVPPEIAQRLQKTVAEIQTPKSRSWWKNLFGG